MTALKDKDSSFPRLLLLSYSGVVLLSSDYAGTVSHTDVGISQVLSRQWLPITCFPYVFLSVNARGLKEVSVYT